MPRKKKKVDDDELSDKELDEFSRKAEEIELEKEKKRVERDFRKKRRLNKAKAEHWEKLFAPILFFVLWLLGWLIYVVFK